MTFKELVMERRSCRAFEPDAVSEDQLAAILEAGCWAPSPLNLQPWEFIVITDPDTRDDIKVAADAAKQQVIDAGGPGWVEKYGLDFVAGAPLLIVVTYDPAKGGLGEFFGQAHGALQAASACIQNMMLTAETVGLGSLWFTFIDPEKLKTLLNVPDRLETAGVIIVGKPAMAAKAPPRKEPRVHYQRYETPA